MSKNSAIFNEKKIVSGAPEGMDAYFLIKKVKENGGLLVHIARNDARALTLRKTIGFFDPSIKVIDFPAWDCIPYDLVSPNREISSIRVSTLLALTKNQADKTIIITTVNGISQRVPSKKLIADSFLYIRIGHSLERDSFIKSLIDLGYQNVQTVTEKGEFTVRGGLVDIYSPDNINPVRLDFFGNQVDRIRFFNPETQMSQGLVNEVLISPVSEFYLNETHIKQFRQNYRKTFGVSGLNDPLYEAVSSGRPQLGFEHWGALFYKKMETLLDYFPKTTLLTVDYRADEEMLRRWKEVNDYFKSRTEDRSINAKYKSKYKPLNPSALYVASDEWYDLTHKREVLQFNPMKLPTGLNSVTLNGIAGRDFAPERQSQKETLFENLIEHIRKIIENRPVLIACYSKSSRERLATILSDNGYEKHRHLADYGELANFRHYVGLIILPVERGFDSKTLAVISERDILGDRVVRSNLKKRKGKDFLKSSESLKVNDLVVHIEHGLGKYLGLEKIKTLGVEREYLSLEYSGEDKLLLPIENIELLSRYGQEQGVLDKLGSMAWQSRKARLKKRIFEMAESLIKVAAERKMTKCISYTRPDFLWEDFCARFPYEETDDQLTAISDVLDDLKSGRPMDRLICGDVGFGKTEVAIRAAFVVASAGKQVVIVTPTTLLCRQHFKNFQLRFTGLPFKIDQLSRLVKARDSSETLQRISKGTTDIIIGTHALLSERIKFSDLGLVIIDEEQHFGVNHKERLKKLKSSLHVLTLTATPIPRTLQLALSGARELSIISSPPADRYAIRTYVSQFDALTVKDALMREYFRGGQSFFVVPRISDIDSILDFLKENLSQLKVCVVHGKMKSRALDDAMSAFYDREFDILVATSIIESGLDIPTVNTLIVYRAEMFGLAQLYQIRGRIGRSTTRAYAYLLTDEKKTLTIPAEKRLQALSNIHSLGAGFALASQDLDIRGAGNLLGDEQSGQIKEVGYELYQQMLEEAVKRIRDGGTSNTILYDDAWSPEINLNVTVLIPKYYVPDINVRLELYRRLSKAGSITEIEDFAKELFDRFGKLPNEVNMLINVMKIKKKCFDAGIVKFDAGPRGVVIKFFRDRFSNPQRLIDYIFSHKDSVKVQGTKLTIKRNWENVKDRVLGSYSIASELARHASK